METKQIVITIGRNIGATPMDETQWSEFKSRIRIVFSNVFVQSEYSGEWNGVSETSCLFIGEVDAALLKGIELGLGLLCHEFNQDAIGLVVNERKTSLVERVAA